MNPFLTEAEAYTLLRKYLPEYIYHKPWTLKKVDYNNFKLYFEDIGFKGDGRHVVVSRETTEIGAIATTLIMLLG